MYCFSLPLTSLYNIVVWIISKGAIYESIMVSLWFLLLDNNWQEFSDPRDAEDARYSLNGRDIDGSRLIVELAKGVCFLVHEFFYLGAMIK